MNRVAPMAWLGARLPAGRLLKNVSANMIGGAWTGLLIVLATPWYVSLLSLEGYGILGFWLLMQMMISLVDLGLGASLVREFADTGEADGHRRQRDLLRTFEYVYWVIALLLTVGLLLASKAIATRWLNLHVFSADQVATAIKWMALALGLQYPNTLYSSGLAGLQSQGRMNLLQMIGNTARYGGGVAVLLWRADPVWFFAIQALVAGAQTLATRFVLWHMVRTTEHHHPRFRVDALQRLWRFSVGMAFSSLAAVLLANVDRLFISKFMPAEELGKYALAFTATSMLQMGIQPFYRAYFPRFAELFGKGDFERLRAEYYQSCRLVAKMVIPFALIAGVFAPEIFLAWIGRVDPTTVDVSRWLLLGIGCAGLMWLPAAFQQAQGWTQLHAIMIAGALCVGAPSLFWTTRQWGTAGATAVWVLHGVSDVTLGLWLMHKRLLKGEFPHWYRTVVFTPLFISLPIVGLSWWLMPSALSRIAAMAWVGLTSAFVVVSIAFFGSVRGWSLRNIKQSF